MQVLPPQQLVLRMAEVVSGTRSLHTTYLCVSALSPCQPKPYFTLSYPCETTALHFSLKNQPTAGLQAAGVPTVPGSDGLIKNEAEAVEVARKVTFPVMIKATAGGGGRGMRLAKTEEEFLPLLQQAQQEADACFGNSAVYLEKYVTNPRHIEFQVRPPLGL